jgi:pheromone shutdown protein TraB
MRNRVWLARSGRGIAGGARKIVKAAQDEASSAALRRETPKAQDLPIAERESVLRRHLLEVFSNS